MLRWETYKTTASPFLEESTVDFELSPQQREVYARAGELSRVFATRAARHDREASLPTDNLNDMRAAGFFKLTISTDLGGYGSGARGTDPLLYLLALEQIARGCVSTAQCLHIHSHGAHYVDQVGTPAQRKEMLGRVVEEGVLINATGSEPGRTSRGLYKLLTTAERVDGGYRMNGVKNYATLADAVAYHLIYGARTDMDMPAGHLGVAVPDGTPGLRIVPGSWDPMGMRGAVSPTLELINCFVSDKYVLGTPGLYPRDRWQAKYHLGFAAQYLGGTQGIIDTLQDYLPRRGTTNDSFTQLRMGEIVVGTESVRWLIYRAAWLWTRGDEQRAELAAMLAKHRAIDNAVICMDKAAQIAGSSAFLGDSPLSRLFRDLRVHTLHENVDRTAATLGQYSLGEAFDTTARL